MEQQALELSHYIRLLWKGKWVILLTALVAVVGVLVFSGLQPDPTPSYRATATVKVEPVSSPIGRSNASNVLTADRSLNTEILLIGSRNVMERALANLQPSSVDSPPEVIALQVAELQRDISVRAVQNTNLLELRAQANSPGLAQAKAEAVVAAYIDYVKEVNAGAIEEALDDIRGQLAGAEQPNGPANNQLAALLPSLGSELAAIARSVEKSHQVITELQGQQNPEAVGQSLNQEVPQIERVAKELNTISLDLQNISGDGNEDSQQSVSGPDDAFSLHASRLERTAKDLDLIHDQVDDIRGEVKNLDPSRAFELAISRSDDAQVVLRRVPLELARVRSNTLEAAQELNSLQTYLETVVDDLRDTSSRLQGALDGKEFTQSERVILEGQMLSLTLGLETVANDLEKLRERARVEEYDGIDIGRIAAAEGDIRTAVEQIDLLSADLDTVADSSSIHEGLTQSLSWIRESKQGLITVSNEFLRLQTNGDLEREQDIADRASIELDNMALTLEVASSQLRNLQSGINDPLLQAKLGSATTRLTSSQNEIISVSNRLSGRSTGRTVVATLDGLRLIGERIQGNAEVLSATLDFLQPTNHVPSTVLDANSAVQAYSNTSEVVQSLDIASRQLQSLARSNFDPLLGGELGALSDRLTVAYGNVKNISDRLASLASEDQVGQISGGLGAATFRLETAAIILQSAAESAQSEVVIMDSTLLPEAADRFKEQTDAGIAILGLVASDLTAIQNTETAPVRYGQLAAAAENIRLARNRATYLSSQLQEFQEGRGIRYFELQQLRAEFELSLLQPQETGITLVDSPVLVTASASRRTFFSRVQLPLGGVAGLLLGSLAVLLKSQLNQTASSSAQLRGRLGLVSLGVIPRTKTSRTSSLPSAAEHDSSAFSEAMQLVGASLAGPLNHGNRSLLVTSAVPKEGKTAVTINLARVLAQYGHRVIVVDGNLRKPEVAQRLNLPQQEGLSTALVRQQNPVDYIVETDTFAVLPGGPPPPNPVELLSSPAMSFFLQQLQNRYDVILIDGAPAIGFAEIKALATMISGAILVVNSASTSFDLVSKGKEELEAAGIPIVGTVLNFAPDEECAHLKHDNYHPGNTSSSAGKMLQRLGSFGKS